MSGYRRQEVAERTGVDLAYIARLVELGIVTPVEQLPPGAITNLCRSLGRADDIGEEDRGQPSIRGPCGPGSHDERLDLGDDGRLVAFGPAFGRYIADGIPGARYVEVPGIDSLMWAGAVRIPQRVTRGGGARTTCADSCVAYTPLAQVSDLRPARAR